MLLDVAFHRFNRRKRERPGSSMGGGGGVGGTPVADDASSPPPSTPGYYDPVDAVLRAVDGGRGRGGRAEPSLVTRLSVELLVTYERCNPRHRFRFKVYI